jgi:hypothetical protein
LKVAPSLFPDRRRKYDWSEVQMHYDAGYSYRRCKEKFKFCAESWTNAVRRGDIKARIFGMPITESLSSPKRNRKHVKSRLIKAGLLRNSCEACGLADWRGNALNMHLDHINGVRDDHRLENLGMLCPNCHSQTSTYSGRNARRGRSLQEQRSSCSITVATNPG